MAAEKTERHVAPDKTDELRLLGLKEVASILGVRWERVRDLIDRGDLIGVRFAFDGDVYIPLESIREWQRRVARGEAVLISAPVTRRGRPPKRPAA